MSVFDQRPRLLSDFRNGDEAALIWLQSTYAPKLRKRLSDGFTCQADGVDLIIQGDWDMTTLDRLVMETFRRAFSKKMRLAYRAEDSFCDHLFAMARDVIVHDLTRAGVAEVTATQRPMTVTPTLHAPSHPPPTRQFLTRPTPLPPTRRRWLVGSSEEVTHVSRISQMLGLPSVAMFTILLSGIYPIWAAIP